MRSMARAEVVNELRRRLRSVCADDSPRWGVMHAGEMICHLRGAFRLAVSTSPVEMLPIPMPRAMLKTIALRAPLRWKQNFETVPALKRGEPEMIPGTFERDRAGLLQAMGEFCETRRQRPDHPYFGAMSAADWMRWGFLHTDHHLRQFGR